MSRKKQRSITREDLEQARSVPDYPTTQPYKLGEFYKELGERLMDERTDLRDLAIIAHRMGLKIHFEFIGPDDEVEVKQKR